MVNTKAGGVAVVIVGVAVEVAEAFETLSVEMVDSFEIFAVASAVVAVTTVVITDVQPVVE